MERVECIVVGAGVIGLAAARALALAGREVLVVEAAGGIGTETSSRNSEVIHAGIYYPAGSAMARLCVAGREQLYAYCASHAVPHKRCGKLIVAADAREAERLESIRARALANGVDDLAMLTQGQACTMEPALACVAALTSPSTGIVDSHAFMLALRGDLEAAGGAIAFHAPFLGAAPVNGGFEVRVGGSEPMQVGCRVLVNAGGLHGPRIAATIEGLAPEHVPEAYYCRGVYFTLSGRAPFRRLVYPVPVPGGLGVHLTLDLGGQARFGPDTEWIEAIDYSVDPARSAGFYAAIRRYWPGLRDGALQPGYAGIRPKIVPPEIATQDFVIQGEATHGLAGLVNLFGIESPGLTASLAIAEAVVAAAGAA